MRIIIEPNLLAIRYQLYIMETPFTLNSICPIKNGEWMTYHAEKYLDE